MTLAAGYAWSFLAQLAIWERRPNQILLAVCSRSEVGKVIGANDVVHTNNGIYARYFNWAASMRKPFPCEKALRDLSTHRTGIIIPSSR